MLILRADVFNIRIDDSETLYYRSCRNDGEKGGIGNLFGVIVKTRNYVAVSVEMTRENQPSAEPLAGGRLPVFLCGVV